MPVTDRGLYPCIGHFFDHPEDGPIYITSGAFEIGGRVSNHFRWTVVATGERHNGYAAHWPCIDDQWKVAFRPKVEPVDGDAVEYFPPTLDECHDEIRRLRKQVLTMAATKIAALESAYGPSVGLFQQVRP